MIQSKTILITYIYSLLYDTIRDCTAVLHIVAVQAIRVLILRILLVLLVTLRTSEAHLCALLRKSNQYALMRTTPNHFSIEADPSILCYTAVGGHCEKHQGMKPTSSTCKNLYSRFQKSLGFILLEHRAIFAIMPHFSSQYCRYLVDHH